jgi:hypothetical protein
MHINHKPPKILQEIMPKKILFHNNKSNVIQKSANEVLGNFLRLRDQRMEFGVLPIKEDHSPARFCSRKNPLGESIFKAL